MSRRLLSMQGDRVLTALWDDGRIIECNVDERVPAFLGRIYLAKVDHKMCIRDRILSVQNRLKIESLI